MSALQPDRNRQPTSPRTARWVERQLDELDATTSLELARVDAVVEIQQEQISALNRVGTSALIATAQLSQTETTLAQMVPHASGRLAAIANLTVVQSAEIVVDTARRIRRSGR